MVGDSICERLRALIAEQDDVPVEMVTYEYVRDRRTALMRDARYVLTPQGLIEMHYTLNEWDAKVAQARAWLERREQQEKGRTCASDSRKRNAVVRCVNRIKCTVTTGGKQKTLRS